jgi:hypothetical protein
MMGEEESYLRLPAPGVIRPTTSATLKPSLPTPRKIAADSRGKIAKRRNLAFQIE